MSSRLPVSGPSFTLPPYSLESVVEWRESDDPHWRNGVEWQTVCADTNTTYDECVTGNAIGDGPVAEQPPVKSQSAFMETYGATPWTIYANVDCSAVGFYEGSTEIVEETFRRDESRRMEEVFWTGVVGGFSDRALPHLMDDTAITSTSDGGADAILQMATTIISGGTSPELALGLLEDAFADCYGGAGILHVTPLIAALLMESRQLVQDGEELYTINGNRVVIGRGYPGTSPTGDAGTWMVMTPPIFGYRSDIRSFEQETTLDRDVNTVHAIAERTYLLGYDCCLIAISVSTA